VKRDGLAHTIASFIVPRVPTDVFIKDESYRYALAAK